MMATYNIYGYLKFIFYVIYVLISLLGLREYPGSSVSYIVFVAAFALLSIAAFNLPRIYSFTFLALFLFLGFWVKLMAYFLLDIAFIEPIGAFSGHGDMWDSSLYLVSLAVFGASAARFLYYMYDKYSPFKRDAKGSVENHFNAKRFYTKWKWAVWVASFLTMSALNILNYYYSFYVVGVNADIVLPYHLNAIVAWLIYFGMALWFVMLAQWEIRSSNRINAFLFLLIVAEAFLSGMTTLSRIIFILHVAPYCVAVVFVHSEKYSKSYLKFVSSILVISIFLFIANVFVIQKLRVDKYINYALDAPVDASLRSNTLSDSSSVKAAGNIHSDEYIERYKSEFARQMYTQIPFLFISRWVGLDAVLAVIAYENKGMGVFADIVMENPGKGVRSIYQKIAGSEYKESTKYTFLTIPGVVAILGASGSESIIVLSMFLIVSMMIATELIARKYIGGNLLPIFIGLNISYIVSQMNFPYLTLVFLLELWVGLLFVFVIQSVSNLVSAKEFKN